MVREGYYFGLPPLFLGIVALVSGWRWGILTGIALVALALFVFYFFRNPERMIPAEPGLVVSPADGRVVVVTQEERAGRPGKRISIFLAIWNVHVNRAPAAGTITKLEYKPGKFLAAWAEKASLENEQNVFTLASEHGELVFKQIAGWVAGVSYRGRSQVRPCNGVSAWDWCALDRVWMFGLLPTQKYW